MIHFFIVFVEGGGSFSIANKNTGTKTGTVLYYEQDSDGEEGGPDDEIEREGPLVFRS